MHVLIIGGQLKRDEAVLSPSTLKRRGCDLLTKGTRCFAAITLSHAVGVLEGGKKRRGFKPSMKSHFSKSSPCIFHSHCGCSSRSCLCLTFASNEPCGPALFKLHELYIKLCVKSAKKMSTEKRLAEELVKSLPIARTPSTALVRFLSASRLPAWLSV